jgi:glycosyltransferase involved in cell wall biosynthesis
VGELSRGDVLGGRHCQPEPFSVPEARMFFMVGAFPPPVHGLSVANESMRHMLEGAGYNIRVLDTAAGDAASSRLGIMAKLSRRLVGFCQLTKGLAAHRHKAYLYLPLSNGKGQYGDLISIVICRSFSAQIIIHHHSFSYLRQPSRLTRCLLRLAGPRTLHITLCQRMRDLLESAYPEVKRGIILSNLALIKLSVATSPRTRPLRTLGFLSNIVLDKGIDRFVELISQLRARGADIVGHVAGPIEDAQSMRLINAACGNGAVIHVGRVDARQKQAFFESIDVLVFPSRYANEAEPFVVLESLAAGIPVISTSRGCIPALIDDGCGLLLDPTADNLEPAVVRIMDWVATPQKFAEARAQVVFRTARLVEQATQQRQSLIKLIHSLATK